MISRIKRPWLRLPPLIFAALAFATAASAATVRITGVDSGTYPELRVTVVAPAGAGQPTLRENGFPVSGLQALNLGRDKSVVLLVDRSKSMAGRTLTDAVAAARAFVAAKGATDRIAVISFGHEATALTSFSSSAADADAGLNGLRTDATTGTALWDAVALAAHKLGAENHRGHVHRPDGRAKSFRATSRSRRLPTPLVARAHRCTRSESPGRTSRRRRCGRWPRRREAPTTRPHRAPRSARSTARSATRWLTPGSSDTRPPRVPRRAAPGSWVHQSTPGKHARRCNPCQCAGRSAAHRPPSLSLGSYVNAIYRIQLQSIYSTFLRTRPSSAHV